MSRPRGPLARAARRGRIVLRMWRLYWLRLEAWLVPSENQRLYALTLLIGVVCGFVAVAFHLSIQLVERGLVERAMEAPGHSWIVWTILTPTLGALLCGIALRHLPRVRGSGIPEVKAAFALRGRGLRFRDSVGKFVLGALQIGSGASLGREGPTVQICAGVATLFGRIARVSPKSLRRLLPVGAAAGIAAAFNAPIAAVTFAIEEIVGDLDRSVLSGVIVAAALASVIERGVLGAHPIFDLPPTPGLHHASSLIVYAGLGVAAALLSIVFTDSMLRLRASFRKQRFVPEWARPGVGGLVTGVLAVVGLLWLDKGGVTGGGYGVLAGALTGGLTVRIMLGLCVLKLVATVFCYGSGCTGGIFAPSLFLGGMLGGTFGLIDQQLLGHEGMVGSFALVGMGAVFAGVVRAPMTSVLILVEMTGGYSLILPLMIANMTAYGVARRFRPSSAYDALLEQDGIQLHAATDMDTLEGVRLQRMVPRDGGLVVFHPDTLARDLVGAKGTQEVYPVVAGSGATVGIITDEELTLLASERSLDLLVNAADVMRPPATVRQTDDLRTVMETMLAHGLPRLPVLDAEGRVVGLVDESLVAQEYFRRHTRQG